jgi:bacillithiol system protein YtxJ
MSDLTRLSELDDLDRWLERSRREPVWVFKHSLTCPTSATALEEFRTFAATGGGEAGYALIEVQTARELSNELARRTGVRHESPQAMLLRDGEAVWHASHWRIRADTLHRTAEATV